MTKNLIDRMINGTNNEVTNCALAEMMDFIDNLTEKKRKVMKLFMTNKIIVVDSMNYERFCEHCSNKKVYNRIELDNFLGDLSITEDYYASILGLCTFDKREDGFAVIISKSREFDNSTLIEVYEFVCRVKK